MKFRFQVCGQKGLAAMAQIHVLDSETIDKIAAGEVVERPASVVKELVENAIDAGANAVTVEARDGGIEFIRITDNGSGMEPSQLRTAFLRHATSKINNADDLKSISSLGFRGEALSSIAAVSRLEVITKTAKSLTGVRLMLEGAAEQSFEEIGAPDGTTFIMRNLFFNTPVRRKFLKQPATEGGYIADLMEHLALSRPDISFKLVLNGQTRFHTSGSGDLKEVIYRIYGRDTAASLVPVRTVKENVRIEGYLGKPVLVRSNRNFEIYFINGRFIRSQVVSRSIEEGYKEYLMQHKFPFCVLHINMENSEVDVNVHPTKMDVRFADGPAFLNLLSGAVRDTLKQSEMIPEASLTEQKKQDRQEKKPSPEPFEKNRTNQYKVMEEVRYEAEMPKMQDVMQNPVWNRVINRRKASETVTDEGLQSEEFFSEALEDLVQTGVSIMNRTSPQENPGGIDVQQEPAPSVGRVSDQTDVVIQQQDSSLQPSADLSRIDQQTVPVSAPVQPVQLDLFEDRLLTVENRSRYHIIGQVFDTYWIVQFEDKMFIIDQHAAHEKVKYERLMKQYHEHEVLSQNLLTPIILSLSGQEETVLKEHLEIFSSLGFEVEAFGGSEYALRSVPVELYRCGEREMFLEVLDELADGTFRNSLRVVEERIASMSCKAAVKGNHALNTAEARMLIDELLTLENPYNCPHGRPTIIIMSQSELEKKFKRIL